MWAIFAGGSLVFAAMVAQQQSPSDPWNFQQLGIAGIVCALLFAWGLTSSKRADRLEREISRLQAEAVQREREYGDTAIPLLTQTAELLRDAKAEARAASGNADLFEALGRIERSMRGRTSDPPGS